MELSLCLCFYLRRSLRGYTVGTIMGLPVKIMEALALQSHCRIPWKYPQYHMSTCSTHHQVTGSNHPLDGGPGGYYQSNIPRVPWATGYGPKFWIRSIPSNGKRLWNHAPHTMKWPYHSRLKMGGHQPKKN
jgi:hypothetical protein